MRMRNLMLNGSAVIVFAAASSASPTVAQQYKTGIPPAITIPESVETRLGTLRFRTASPTKPRPRRSTTISTFSMACRRSSPRCPPHRWRQYAKDSGPSAQTIRPWRSLKH